MCPSVTGHPQTHAHYGSHAQGRFTASSRADVQVCWAVGGSWSSRGGNPHEHSETMKVPETAASCCLRACVGIILIL